MLSQITEKQHPLFIAGAIFFAFFLLIKRNTLTMVQNDFKNKKFLFLTAVIAIFSYFSLNSPSTTQNEARFKEATKKAITALLIAYLAHLDLVFAPFFLIFALEYNLSKWV